MDEQRSLLTDTPSPSPLIGWRAYHFPLDWRAHFGIEANREPQPLTRLHLEVGFGDGRYTVRRALEHPEEQFVGLEISSGSIQRALNNIKRHKVDNVRILKINAEYALQHLFAPDSLQSITVNFPDPWPKDKHEDNRLLRLPFFQLASSRLQMGGEIRLATDHPDYFAFSKAQAEASQFYSLHDREPPPAVFETKYALKWKAQGKPLYYKVFQLEQRSIQAFPNHVRSEIMPHAILRGRLPIHDSDSAFAEPQVFSKQIHKHAQGHIILHEAATTWSDGTHSPRLLIRSTLKDEEILQQVLIMVKQRSEDEVLVGIDSFGDPVITKTARGAVHVVTEWLISKGLEVMKRDY